MRRLTILFAALLPFSRLRIFIYRTLLNYRISSDSHIGILNYIDIFDCEITGARIGSLNRIGCQSLRMAPGSTIRRFNRINNVASLTMENNSIIGTRNLISGTPTGLTPFKKHENLTLGNGSNIVAGHLFDLSDSVTIGADVTIGGQGTQFWTHGFDLNHVKIQAPIRIADNVYIGSGCMIMAGVKIVEAVSIGSGSVVPKSILESGFYISSNLIRKGNVADWSDQENILTHKGAKFIRKE